MPPISESDATGEKQKQLDHEIREMVSALTSRLANLHNLQKAGRSSSTLGHDHDDDDDENAARIITLVGNNIGATMRGDMEPAGLDDNGLSQDQEAFLTYVNNNFQAVNNSIMLGGEYTANDPGVHLDISDYAEDAAGDEARRPTREAKRGKRKGTRGVSKTEQHRAEHSDDYADALATAQS